MGWCRCIPWCRSRAAKLEQLEMELPVVDRGTRPNNMVKTARYTLLNFVFKCGFEQFRNLSNIYFLVIVVLAILGTNTNLFESPYSAAGTLLGLVLVVGFTMAFEGYYDIKRHSEDREVNARIAYRLRPGDGHMEEIPWADVRPGDLLKVHDRAQFPADLLFVTSCAVGNKCYVETANIDGETNLKIKHVAKDLVDRCILPDQAASLRAVITYDLPNAFLTFSGSARVFDDTRYMREPTKDGYTDVPLDTSNILLRGSVLRNTPWVLGIVLYAGPETKVVQSSSDPPSKMSRIQKLINKIIVLILAVDIVLCTVSSLIEIYGYPNNTSLYYLRQASENTFQFPTYIANVCTFIVLYSSLLPISLLFCMTFSNFWQAMFVHWDLDMYHAETDTPAKCNTMELVQELGQVSYLFSDKTGTLTRNEMKLVGCTVNGRVFGIGNGLEGTGSDSSCTIKEIFADAIKLLRSESPAKAADRAALMDFCIVLSVCHTVLVDTTTGKIQYNAEGPDEEALVSAAAEIGLRLVATDNGTYTVNFDLSTEEEARLFEATRRQVRQDEERAKRAANGDKEADQADEEGEEEEEEEEACFSLDDCNGELLNFEILAINHFNSTRKRMSVVCRRPDGRLVLLVKGADTIMFELTNQQASAQDQEAMATLARHLDAFANDGLRTLVMAQRELTEDEYAEWRVGFDEASNALGERRAELLAAAAERIERDLVIVGASAIEDRLQAGVPETLVALREAGVKTWVLTGDKVETAINISFSARLFTPEMEVVRITSESSEENLATLRDLHALLVPQNLAEDSEKRKRGREAVRERSGKNLLQHGATSTMSTLGKAVHGVRSTTVNTMEKAGRATLDTVERAGRSTINTVEKAGRAAFSVVSLRQFRSPTENGDGDVGSFSTGASPVGEAPRIPVLGSLSESEASARPQGASAEAPSAHANSDLGLTGEAGGGLLLSESQRSRSHTVDECMAGAKSPPTARSQAASAFGEPMSATSSATSPSKKRRSIPSLSKLWNTMHMSFGRDGQGTSRGTVGRTASEEAGALFESGASAGEWRSAAQPLPPGVENASEGRVNERELKGTEKNLDGFEAQNMALVLTGPALRGLLKTELGTVESEELLLSIARLCSVVVACRVSPKQKALIVRMVKKGVRMQDGSSPITLAIGDGANDVAMIQEARVGVGISGHEGRQAVNSADFAIAQFRFLQELMLVHGRWNYRRAATMVLFVFYANILFVLTAFVYNFYNKFSGSALYWVFLTTVYSYPTQIPIAVIACLNKDISRKTALEYPAMYISGRRNLHLDKGSALEYIFKSFLHAFLICAICIIWAAPRGVNISALGTTVYMACIWVCVSRSCLETYTWTWLNVGVVIFGYFCMLVFEPIYYSTDPTIYVQFGPTVLWAGDGVTGYLWSNVFLVTAMCMVYDVFAIYVRKEFFPSVVDIVIEIDRGFGESTGNKKSRLRKVNKIFRRIAQPLTIPQNAISELFAAANIKNIRRGADRSAFDYDHPEDERVRSLVNALLRSSIGPMREAMSLKLSDSGAPRELAPMSAPVRTSLSSLHTTIPLDATDSHDPLLDAVRGQPNEDGPVEEHAIEMTGLAGLESGSVHAMSFVDSEPAGAARDNRVLPAP